MTSGTDWHSHKTARKGWMLLGRCSGDSRSSGNKSALMKKKTTSEGRRNVSHKSSGTSSERRASERVSGPWKAEGNQVKEEAGLERRGVHRGSTSGEDKALRVSGVIGQKGFRGKSWKSRKRRTCRGKVPNSVLRTAEGRKKTPPIGGKKSGGKRLLACEKIETANLLRAGEADRQINSGEERRKELTGSFGRVRGRSQRVRSNGIRTDSRGNSGQAKGSLGRKRLACQKATEHCGAAAGRF